MKRAAPADGRLALDTTWVDPDHHRTLMTWLANVDAYWPEIAHRYSERTRRMFRYYLAVCAGAFRARHLQLWQVAFSRDRAQRYDAPR
ncbi:Mycolic acid cyclopropane synthetase [Halomonas shengliensis]|uniref:Mycolic acid cyclopropane synthetase n=1 Tax=Halomonas shengliensis TaxID=419597 RepID=A0A1H0NS28_9GAMM|nr:class I SAM-dependent methyltransferase [Halomonas shengliensis]SDO95453.1 Mycolic acid cyclopropane synthetase [Halomonas shengliensis]